MPSLRIHAAGQCQRAERLESRRLLSGIAGNDDVEPVLTAPGSATVQVVEVLEFSRAEEEDDEEEATIDPSELPPEVRESFESAYPGAEILEIEVEGEDGEAEYDIATRVDGALLEVGMASDGEILEVSQVLTESELPQEVIDWLHANFDEPDLVEIEVVNEDGQTSYELMIVSEEGSPVEVALRLDEIVVEAGTQLWATNHEPVETSATDPATQGPAAASPAEAPTPATVDPIGEDQAPSADAKAEPEVLAAPEATGQPAAETSALSEDDPIARESAQEFAADMAGSALALPDVLIRAMRIDLGSIDEQLLQLLAEIDRMAQGVARPESGGLWMKFALLLAIVAGAQIFRNNSLQRRRLSSVFMHSDRSSAWSLWSATTIQK